MKKNKSLGLLIATITTASLIAGVTFAWFTSVKESTAVDVSTATIGVDIAPLGSKTNTLPGDKIKMNDANSKVTNTGSRDAIVEISFEDQILGTLAPNSVVPSEFAADYTLNTATNLYEFSKARRDKVIFLTMENVLGTSNFVKVGDKYYAMIPHTTSNTAALDDIFLNITGELGGSKMENGVLTPSRQFEQQSKFSVQYKATAVQRTREAIKDIFGDTVYNALPATYYVD